MADTPPETATAAARSFVLTLALAAAFAFVEQLVAGSYLVSALCLAVAVGLTILDFKLKWLLSKLRPGATTILNTVAGDPRWWVAAVLAILIFTGLPAVLGIAGRSQTATSEGDVPVPTAVVQEFAKAQTGMLGKTTSQIETTKDIYQASYDHAMVVWLLPVVDVFVLPTDPTVKAIRYPTATWNGSQEWLDDSYLRPLFDTPQDKKSPEYIVAQLWFNNPSKWNWIGWRQWSCQFYKDSFYYQMFENGVMFGVLPMSEALGYSEIITVANDGAWTSSRSSTVEAPACNANTPTVFGIPLHGRFVGRHK